MAQVVKARICNLWTTGLNLTAGGTDFRYRPLASFSLEIGSLASESNGKNNGGPNQCMSCHVKITPWLSKIRAPQPRRE